MNSNIQWCRSKAQELASQGYNQSEKSWILQISQPTVNRHITYLTASKREHQAIHRRNTARILECSLDSVSSAFENSIRSKIVLTSTSNIVHLKIK